jgi:hypothetical protein
MLSRWAAAGVSGMAGPDVAAIEMPGKKKIIAPRVKRDDIVDPSFCTALNNLIGVWRLMTLDIGEHLVDCMHIIIQTNRHGPNASPSG